jgi:hypothetical protein
MRGFFAALRMTSKNNCKGKNKKQKQKQLQLQLRTATKAIAVSSENKQTQLQKQNEWQFVRLDAVVVGAPVDDVLLDSFGF